MTQSKHTPGKWIESIWGATPVFKGFHQGCYIQKGNDEMIAFVTARDEVVGKANAHLIAAAPDLLEALELAYACLQDAYTQTSIDNDPKFLRMRAAIAKARGQS